MKPVLWFRLSAGILLLFAIGHTVGFLTFRPAAAEGLAVWNAMNNVHFSQDGYTFSYAGFYKGLGLFVTGCDLFLAWMAWRLGSMARRGVSDTRAIAWVMCALQAVGMVLAWSFFALPQIILSAVAALCLGVGAWSSGRQKESGV